MGLPIRDLVTPRAVPWSELSGRTLAVDGYNALYQFLATIRQADGRLFTDRDGRVTSHLIGTLYRTTSILSQGVRPVWVMDGRPPELKAGTLSARLRAKERAEAAYQEALAAGDLETARRKAAMTSRLTRPMVEEVVHLLEALGVPSLTAPSEGEAEAAHLARLGKVWGVASEDYDTLLFGAPRLVRGLAAKQKGGTAPAALLIDREQLLADLGISEEELITIGLLVGSDFNEGARGYGPKRALKLVRRHLGFEESLRVAGLDPASVTEARELFRHPHVADLELPSAGPVQHDAAIALLVGRHGFDPERVEAALGRAQRRAPSSARPTVVARGKQRPLEAFGESS